MRIKVNQYYQGRKSNEQLISAGIYEVGDPALYGIEDYLVNDQQKAEYIEDKVIAPAMVSDEPAEETPRKRTSKKAE